VQISSQQGAVVGDLPKASALIVIDVQKAFDNPVWGQRNNPDAEQNVALLLSSWRATSRPIIHIQHRNEVPGGLFSPGEAGFECKPEALPAQDEAVLFKRVNSAFIGTDLEQRLHALGVRHVVVCGITTDHCVSTTTRMAANLDFATTIVSDATATFERTGPDGRHWTGAEMHDSALASLNGEFATVSSTQELIGLL
jgi:nicotinamidase-related amidase